MTNTATSGQREKLSVAFQPLMVAGGHDVADLEATRSCSAERVFLDLESKVPEHLKAEALANVLRTLRENDWSGKYVIVRINGFDSLTTFEEIGALAAEPKLGAILFPMAYTSGDVIAIDRFVRQASARAGRDEPLRIELLIETPQALAEINSIASCSNLVSCLHFGASDFSKGMGITTPKAGMPHPEYGLGSADGPDGFHPADLWHYPLMQVVVAARAYGLKAFDGPFSDYDNIEGFTQQALRARAMAFDGKWTLNPGQLTAAQALAGAKTRA